MTGRPRGYRRILAALLLLAWPTAPVRAQPATLPITFDCDLLEYDRTLDEATGAELKSVHSVHDVMQVLRRHKVPFTRSRAMISLHLPPELYRSITGLPHGEPFSLPSRNGGIVCGPLT